MMIVEKARPDIVPQQRGENRSEALERLHHEMTALFGIMPVPFMIATKVTTSDAEIEAQFDNMPV